VKPALLALLAFSLATSAWLALQPEADDLPVPAARPRSTPTPRPAAAPTGPAVVLAGGLPTRAADWPAPGAAAIAAWQGGPAPVASAPVADGAAPQRPPPAPFPYQWIGQLDDGSGRPQQLLASAQRCIGVHMGDLIDRRWRLARGANGELLAVAVDSGDTQPVRGAPAQP